MFKALTAMLSCCPSCLAPYQGQTWVSAAPLQLQRGTCASSCLWRGPHEASSEVVWGHSQRPSVRKRWSYQASPKHPVEAPDPHLGPSLFLMSHSQCGSQTCYAANLALSLRGWDGAQGRENLLLCQLHPTWTSDQWHLH